MNAVNPQPLKLQVDSGNEVSAPAANHSAAAPDSVGRHQR
jgi:hypothetical protein